MTDTITTASMNRRIFRLALPNILSNITIPLLGMVDLALVGHLNDTSAIGAIAISTTLFSIVYWNFSFLRMGTTGLTAQALGEGDPEVQGRTLSQSMMIGIIAGLIIVLLQIPIRDIALELLHPDDSLIPYIKQYFSIVIWGAPAMLCTYALNGWLIGMQNTWWPMVVSIITNVVNIAVSASLVIWANMGVAGVATGTLVAQWLGMMLLLLGAYFLFLRDRGIKVSYRWLEVRVGLRKYFGTNVHIFFRTLLLALVSAFFTYAGTQMGPLPLAANALLYQFFMFFSYFIDGFAYASEAIVGHSYGKKDPTSLIRAIRHVMIWGLSIAVGVSLIYIALGSRFLHLLSDQAEVLAYAHEYLWWVYLLPITGFAAFLMDGVFVGLTATREMLWSMFAAVVTFFLLYYTIPTARPNDALWLSFVSYLFVRGIAQLFMLRHMRGIGIPFSHTYYISVGSTLSDMEEKITQLLTKHFPDGKLSSYTYSTDITGKSDQRYTNAVIRIESTRTSDELNEWTKKIEKEAGRDSNDTRVIIDLDVVVKDTEILRPIDYGRTYFSNGYRELKGPNLQNSIEEQIP